MSTAKRIAVIGSIFAAMIVGLFVSVGTWYGEQQKQDCDPNNAITPVVSALDVSLPLDGLTIKGKQITTEQATLAATFIGTAWANKFDNRVAAVLVDIATAESTVSNPEGGDASSAGPYQLQTWWGSLEQRRDPIKATTMVLFGGELGSNNYSEPGIVDITGWKTMDPAELAYQVMKPDISFKDRYVEYLPEAEAIVAAAQRISFGATVVPAVSTDCGDPVDPIEQMVRNMQGQIGTSVDPAASYELLRVQAEHAGIQLPATFEEFLRYKGSAKDGVTAKFISADDIMSGTTALERGMIPFIGPTGATKPSEATSTGAYIGAGGEATVRLMTYNLQVGEGFEDRVAQLREVLDSNQIDIVGLQEVEGESMYKALALPTFLGDRYGIYPEDPSVVCRNCLAGRPIVYDRTRFTVTAMPPLEFRRMDDKMQPAQMPVVRFHDLLSQRDFYVINVHFPAFRRYAEQRFHASEATRDMVKQLIASGLPVMLVGDFNEGTGVRDQGNYTYQQDRTNLLWSMLHAEHLMEDSRDLSAGITFNEPYPVRTIGSVDRHLLSSDLEVIPGSFREIPGMLSDHKVALVVDVVIPSLGSPADENDPNMLGYYVGVNESGKVDQLKLLADHLIGAVKLTVTTTVSGAGGKWQFPIQDGPYVISDTYGLANGRFHPGTDFSTFGHALPLYAMHAGTVAKAGYDSGWGNFIVVETGIPVPNMPGATYKYLYGHLSVVAPVISEGATLQVGELVGNVGDTGNSTGFHLHLTICTTMDCVRGSEVGSLGTVDPVPFMQALKIPFTV